MRNAIARALKRLNVKSSLIKLPVFGQALYDGLSLEFERLDNFKNIVKNSVVPNENMDVSTLDDYEKKYNIRPDLLLSDKNRIDKIIERASRNGNGGAEWLQQQIQKAGFDLYVIENSKNFATGGQFGDFQFGTEQFGGLVTYRDPRNIPGEIFASSPCCGDGGYYISFGDFQFGDVQFGTLMPNTTYPVPRAFTIPATPDSWGYVFFISPFPDRLATEVELQALSKTELASLKKLVIELKHARNWAVVQVTTATLQREITEDGIYKQTTDGLINNVSSNL